MNKIRIRFIKDGPQKYISHLDLLKTFSRAFRRCGIPVAYSQGFNPHPELVFCAPLPLGFSSECEFVDVTLSENMNPEEVMKRLEGSLPSGIVPEAVRALAEGEPNVMKNVYACRYLLTFSGEKEAFLEYFTGLFKNQIPIIAMKRSKSGTKETDLLPMIYDISVSGNDCFATLAAGNEMNLRPDLLAGAVIDKFKAENPLSDISLAAVRKLELISRT